MNQQDSAWKCGVCGYIHRGPVPPSQCVVCGAPENQFDPYVDPDITKTAGAEKWKCLVCNYTHTGSSPPESCPVCSASQKNFEAIQTETKILDRSSTDEHIIIVGAGIAGISAAEAIRTVNTNAKVTLISKEPHLPYYRLNLTRLIAGEIPEESLPIFPESWYIDNNIDLMLGAEVTKVSTTDKQVFLKAADPLSYDKLILSAGSHPFIPPVTGVRREGVTPLRTLDDANYIMNTAETSDHAVIVGGGILGLEAAAALAIRYSNLTVTVIEGFGYLMPRQLNEKAAALLSSHIKKLGINLITGTVVKEIEGDEHAKMIVLENGDTLPADLVIFSAGVRPNSYVARICDVCVNNGIIVDDSMSTYMDSVYAAGDIAEHRGVLYGLWNAAQFQGAIAGLNAAGKPSDFGGIPRSNTIKVLGIDLFSIGLITPTDGSFTVIEKEANGHYTRYIFKDSVLAGAILYGNTAISAELKKAIEDKWDFSELLMKRAPADAITDWIGKH